MIQNNKIIRGINNGTWGFGMYGSLYSPLMNGPFGSVGANLPRNRQAAASNMSPRYNNPVVNGPDYVDFESISGYNLSNFGASCDSISPKK